ncbi:MAG: pre-peptidase C-terminal domain-containing protein [Pirellulaceae bacterium]|jgi:hypothetical protein|nr:pre-peptidase C-terminal domain-containing protein [Pirellulaceae bacterium]
MLRLWRLRRWAATAAILVSGLVAAESAGAEPVVTSLQPSGVQRGTEAVLHVYGARLSDAEALLFYEPGVTVTGVRAVDDQHAEVSVSVAADSTPGLRAFRLRSATGISNLQLVSIGALPEVAEQEPNSEFAHPQAVPLGCTISGVVQNEDVDYFAVSARKGERITVELEGVRLGAPPGDFTFFDPYLAILNAERFELATCDDAPLLRQDSLCAIQAPADGTYIVEVRESAYGGSDLCKYRLHVGAFPRPRAVFPPGGTPGESLQVQWLGDPLDAWTSQVILPTDTGPVAELFAEDAQGIAPSPLRVRVNELAAVVEVEPNNAGDTATRAAAPGALHGIIQEPRDVDYYRFSARQGETYDVRVFARDPLRSPLDSVLSIIRADGAGVIGNDDSGGPDSAFRFTAPEEGEYLVVIHDQLMSGGPEFVYRVELTPVVAALNLSLPERVQYVPMTLSVPRGNRMAMLVSAERVNFGGPLELSMLDLPAGMALHNTAMDPNLSTIPVLVTAAADAPVGGSLVDLVGRCTDPNVAVTGRLRQRTMLVRGQNNVDVWGHDARRLAVAVTQEAPFEIEVVPPRVPIVRDGSMQLKVRARRQEGFQEPIALQLLYHPPGIGSAAATIPGDQPEVTIPLTANSSPGVGQWPVAVLGRARGPSGDIEVSSQLAPLEIAEPFFTLAFEKAAAEQGQTADVVVRIEKHRDFPGAATVQLLGLPAGTTTDPQPLSFTADQTDLVFKVQLAADARAGKYQTLVCSAVVTLEGEPVAHTFGGGELRIDEPLPQAAAAPVPEPPPEPAATEAPPKPPSRLELLRQKKQQQGGGAPASAGS